MAPAALKIGVNSMHNAMVAMESQLKQGMNDMENKLQAYLTKLKAKLDKLTL